MESNHNDKIILALTFELQIVAEWRGFFTAFRLLQGPADPLLGPVAGSPSDWTPMT